MSHIEVNIEKCKGCGICLVFCNPQVLALSQETNSIGAHYPIQLEAGKKGKPCNGCANCAVVCPDMCFEVWRTKKKKKVGAVS